MDKTIYTQAISRIRVLENKLLDNTKINRMIESSTADEAMRVLQETEYSEFMGNVKRAEDYEILLSEELKRVYALMYNISPERLIVDIMSLKYDYHNIKVLIKEKILEKDFSNLIVPVGTVPVEILKECVYSENCYDLEPIMREGTENAMVDFEVSKDPQRIDIILDKYLYKDLLERAEKLDDSYVLKFIKNNIDLINIKTYLRVKKQKKDRDFLDGVLIEGGKVDIDLFNMYFNDSIENFINKISHTDYNELLRAGVEEFHKSGKLNTLEKLSDNFIMDFIREAKYISFGVEPLIAYLFAKEAEIKVIRIVMVGKLNNVHPDLIKERLRDIYV